MIVQYFVSFLWLVLQSFSGGKSAGCFTFIVFRTSGRCYCRELEVRDCGISGHTHIFVLR